MAATAGRRDTATGRATPAGSGRGSPRSTPGSGQAPLLSRIVKTVVAVLPGWVRVLLAVLGLLALCFGSAWTVMYVRGRRLGRQTGELSLDAELLRQALAPRPPGRLGTLDFSVAVEPAERPPVGRGFHDVFPVGANGVGIVIGQVSTREAAPLARAALLRHGLRTHLELGLAPRSALRRTGELRQDAREGGVASATVAVYDGARGTLTYACAGHPAPLIFGSVAQTLAPIAHFSPPLGAGECGQRQTLISLPPGSGACIYNDGVRWLPEKRGAIERNALTALQDEEIDAAELGAEVAAACGDRSDDFLVCLLRPALAGCGPPAHIEELVVTADDWHAAHSFLLACGLAPQAAAEVAATSVDRAGGARSLLRIAWDSDGADYQVLPYRSDSEWPARAA